MFLIYFAGSNAYYFSRPLFLSLTANDTSQADLMLFLLDLMMAFSIVFGGFFLRKTREITVIFVWAVTLITVNLFLMILEFSYPPFLWLICVKGIFLGLCVLAFDIYFCSQTRIEERGRVAGTIVSLSLSLSLLLALFLVERWSPFLIMMFLGVCTLLTNLLKPDKKSLIAKEKTTYYDKKNFLLYQICWAVFCLNNVTFPILFQQQLYHLFPKIIGLIDIVKFFGASSGALIGGLISDRAGRKPVLLCGLTLLGIVSTLAGLTLTAEVFLLHYFIEGFCWGIFLVLYYLILWGDFNNAKDPTLYYSIGLSTFHFSRAFGFLIIPFLSNLSITMTYLFSAMIIFISNIPLIYAQETLPTQYKMAITNLEEYINRLKKRLRKITGHT